MIFPTVIDPRLLLKEGQELDTEREVSCMCGKQVKLSGVKLCWTYLNTTPDNPGWYAVCCQSCYLYNVVGGNA